MDNEKHAEQAMHASVLSSILERYVEVNEMNAPASHAIELLPVEADAVRAGLDALRAGAALDAGRDFNLGTAGSVLLASPFTAEEARALARAAAEGDGKAACEIIDNARERAGESKLETHAGSEALKMAASGSRSIEIGPEFTTREAIQILLLLVAAWEAELDGTPTRESCHEGGDDMGGSGRVSSGGRWVHPASRSSGAGE